MDRTASIREAKAGLPHLVDLAKRGETILITRHGKVVARLVPPIKETASMNENEQDQRTQPEGRIFHTTVYGDTPEELEFAALDKAREFFGEGPVLQIVDDYQVIGVWNEEGRASEKKYDAAVRVRAVNR